MRTMLYNGYITLHTRSAQSAGTLHPGSIPTAWSRAYRCEAIQVEARDDRAAREAIIVEFYRRHPAERRYLAGLSYVPACRPSMRQTH